MTTDEIKQEIKKQGYTLATLAQKMQVGVNTLRNALNGSSPLTASLRNHIMLALHEPSDVVLVYRVSLPDESVRELCGHNYTDVARRTKAVEAVLRHNLRELSEAGQRVEWTDEERTALGLQEADALERMMQSVNIVAK